jgi:hypothetical protein
MQLHGKVVAPTLTACQRGRAFVRPIEARARGGPARFKAEDSSSTQAPTRPARRSGGWAAIEPGKPLQPWAHDLPPELAPNEVDITVRGLAAVRIRHLRKRVTQRATLHSATRR